jgi:hypothetical protein
MNNPLGRNTRPTSALVLGMIMSLALLESAPAAHAQAAQSGTAETTAPEQDPAQQEEASPEAPEPDAKTERSPFDYRSSEEISEDLSVSFPVDI